MELNKEELLKYKKILGETMKAFIAFCKDNNLQYYACGGTCIGAIRHKGFIPWDDDIDVLMPREDYTKFLSLRNKLENSVYEILNPDIPGYYLPFAKFVNKNTTIVETKDFPFVIGAFVDVFPQDTVGDYDNAEYMMIQKKKVFGSYCMAIKKHSVSKGLELLCTLKIRTFVKYVIYSLFGRLLAPKFLEHFHRIENQLQNQKGDKCMCYDGFYGYQKELCEKAWFGEGQEVAFEDFYITVPSDYDAYLKHMYGDYMTPPPLDKQVSHHNLYFIDMDKRWKINDVLKLNLGKQKKKEYKYE